MISVPAPFNRFQGRKMIALLLVFGVYVSWYLGAGFYDTLQGFLFYTGPKAHDVLGAAEKNHKYLGLILDVPLMIMQALVFEALMAFGLRRGGVPSPRWLRLFALPLAYLLCDFGENSVLALTLASGSSAFGTAAGVFTSLKWLTWCAGWIIGLYMLLRGLRAGRNMSEF